MIININKSEIFPRGKSHVGFLSEGCQKKAFHPQEGDKILPLIVTVNNVTRRLGTEPFGHKAINTYGCAQAPAARLTVSNTDSLDVCG